MKFEKNNEHYANFHPKDVKKITLYGAVGKMHYSWKTFFLYLLFMTSISPGVSRAQLLETKQVDSVSGCIDNARNSEDASLCAKILIEQCYSQSSHTDIEKAQCTNDMLSQTKRLFKAYLLQMTTKPTQYKAYGADIAGTAQTYANKLCAWPAIFYKGGSLALDLRASCLISVEVSAAYELYAALNATK